MNKNLNFIALFFIFITLMYTSSVYAGESKNTIKVGYPIQAGLTDKDNNGNYKGYTYDYLQMVAQYTGFDYEFVEVPGDTNTQLLTLFDMLEKGEIDVMGAMKYSDSLAQRYDYVINNYGTYELGLYVLDENIEFNSTNIYSNESLRVAIYGNNNTPSTIKLEDYMSKLGVNLEKVFVDSFNEQIEAMKNGTADVLLANSVNSSENSFLRCVCRFDAQPIYFTVTKGNNWLKSKMNEAIATINTTDPYYMTELMQKYFYNTAQIMPLTEIEKEYIKSTETMNVVLPGGFAPLAYNNGSGEASGIIVNILNHIISETGLSMKITVVDDIKKYQEIISSGDADLVVFCDEYSKDNNKSENYKASMPFLSIPVLYVVNNEAEISNDAKYSEPFKYINQNNKNIYSVENYLKAINKNKTNFAYINSYSVEYYKNKLGLDNIYTYLQDEATSNTYTIGINKKLNTSILTIINKSIHNIDDKVIFQSYLENIKDNNVTFSEFIHDNKKEVTFYSILFILFIVIIALIWKYLMEKKTKEEIVEQSKIDGMTGLYISSAFRETIDKVLNDNNDILTITFLVIDVDNFKSVNDTFGHYYGDKILKGFAKSLKQVFDEEYIIGRIGGDEFAVFSIQQITIDTLNIKCVELNEQLKNMNETDNNIQISASIGGVLTKGNSSYEFLFRQADEVMYSVKQEGRNGYKILEIKNI